MAQKQISMGQKIVEEMLNHAPLGSQIEVDQHVATEDDVHTLHECHASVVRQIEPAEADVGTSRGMHLELIALPKKVLAAVCWGQIARAVVAVHGLFGMGKRTLVEIGGEKFDGPVFEQAVDFLQQ